MREILFRGKDLDGEWKVGFYVRTIYLSVAELLPYDPENFYHKILGYVNGDSVCVEPSTVGQYTGMKDRNGKMIFEGDIICSTFVDGVVGFGGGCFVVSAKDEPLPNHRGLLEAFVDELGCEVIGNIHDKEGK